MAAATGKKAILVVSFGTSFHGARAKSIDRIEKEIAEAFSDYRIYRAWTSKRITAKLLRRDGIRIPGVKEAVAQMLEDGITQAVVQPTYLIDGVENKQMRADVGAYGKAFKWVSFGEPLLATAEDREQVIRAVMKEFAYMDRDDVLVLVGHGTARYANFVYADLDCMLKKLGYTQVFLGTIKAYPSLDTLLEKVGRLHPKKVVLAPFLLAAGNHAVHDLCGEDEDSWKSRFEAENFSVDCVMKGLGEYAGVRRIYVEHAKAAETKGKERVKF